VDDLRPDAVAWLPILLAVPAPAVWLRRRRRERRRFRAGLCGACGYDLTGNVTGVCPECGQAA
jgi:hypothetical protein